MGAYEKRVLKGYRAIVERTPGIGSMKDNMFVILAKFSIMAKCHARIEPEQ